MRSHHQIVISRTFVRWGVLCLCREVVGVFYSSSQLGKDHIGFILCIHVKLLLLLKRSLFLQWSLIDQEQRGDFLAPSLTSINVRKAETFHPSKLLGEKDILNFGVPKQAIIWFKNVGQAHLSGLNGNKSSLNDLAFHWWWNWRSLIKPNLDKRKRQQVVHFSTWWTWACAAFSFFFLRPPLNAACFSRFCLKSLHQSLIIFLLYAWHSTSISQGSTPIFDG